MELDEIADYIAVENYSAASKLVNKIFSKVDKLKDFPDMGQRVREVKGREYRTLIVKPCKIYYRQEASKIYILFVRRLERG